MSFFGVPYEVSVQTTYWGNRAELVEVLDLAARGLLSAEMTTFPLEEAPEPRTPGWPRGRSSDARCRAVRAVHAGPVTPAVPAPYLELRETHCAGLLLVGDRVLKFKKPVDLGFLDFSTPALRAEACRREVELNRRFSPDVYLGVGGGGPARRDGASRSS